MSKTAQLEQYLDNPNVQAFLSMLRDAEGTAQTGDPYRTRFGGAIDEKLDLNGYPTFVKKEFTQTDGKKNKSGATGAYQFLEKTWKGLANEYGFDDFSPRTQDLGAIALLKQNGALPHILNGDFSKAVQKSNSTWASLPGSPYAQHTRSMDFVNNSLSKGLGQPVTVYDKTDKTDKYLADVRSAPTPDEPVEQRPTNNQLETLNKKEPTRPKPLDFAVLNDGSEVHPESQAELDFLNDVANNNTRTDDEKTRLAKMGVLFDNNKFDINFSNDKRKNYPTELDEPLRRMIREN